MNERPLTQAEQFAQLIDGQTEHRDVNVRSVVEGFVISGQRRWVDDSGIAIAQIQAETIAEDHGTASMRIANFLASGKFV